MAYVYEAVVTGGPSLLFETAEEAVFAVSHAFYVSPGSRDLAVGELEAGGTVNLSYGGREARIVPVEVAE